MRCRLQRNRHPRIEVINEQQTYKESSSFSSSSASLHPHCGGAPHQEGWRARHHHQGPTSVTTCVARPIDLKKRQQALLSLTSTACTASSRRQLRTDALWDRQFPSSSDEIAVRQSLFARRAAAPWRAYFSFRRIPLAFGMRSTWPWRRSRRSTGGSRHYNDGQYLQS